MNSPALDAYRFGVACVLGLFLGICYGLLRPLRPRLTALSDLLFLIPAGYCWLYLGFAVCRGDIRLSYCAGLVLGAIAWDRTFGRWLMPVFFSFWKVIFQSVHLIFGFFEKIFKKSGQKLKKIFALLKKWFTIIWSKCPLLKKNCGGVHRGKKKKHSQSGEAGIPSQPAVAQVCRAGHHRPVHSSADHPAAGYRPVSGADRPGPGSGCPVGAAKSKAGQPAPAKGHRRRGQKHRRRAVRTG
ncbi:MAG: spore cortex biosynthesis protein YabQ [Oscillospiraceae bacterium]|nr:spore cortex biosynthesis protein YabQ [Oscillospiraceae bacterium]